MMRLVAALLFICLAGPAVTAAEITYIGHIKRENAPGAAPRGQFEDYRLSGPIEEGDLEKVKKIVRKNDYRPRRLNLDSPGGSFIEAAEIANFVWDNGITTLVNARRNCLSACAIIFMSGSIFDGDNYHPPNRYLHVLGRLGFHAPFINPEQLGDVPAGKAAELAVLTYKTALTAATKFLELSHKSKWPSSLVEALLKVQSARKFIEIDTVDKAGRWHISLFGYRPLRFNRFMPPHICRNAVYWKTGRTSASPQAYRESGFDKNSYKEFVRNVNKSQIRYVYTNLGMDGYNCTVSLDTRAEKIDFRLMIGEQLTYAPDIAIFSPRTRLKDIAVK